jgi:chromate transporter
MVARQTEDDIMAAGQGARQSHPGEVAILFLRLGLTAFGGPAAHISIMEDEVVRRRRWLTQEEFLDLLGAVNLIPGPNSTEMAIHLGYRRAGWRGLILGGLCFILPAMLMVMGIAWIYVRYGSLPQFEALLYGVKPVVIAIVLQALWGLGRKATKTKVLAAIGLLAVVAAGYFGLDALTVIVVGGVVAALVSGRTQEQGRRLRPILIMLALAGGILAFSYSAAHFGRTTEAQVGLKPLFLYFLKVGSVLYGSGYVLLAFLQSDLVARWHWLTSAQLLDATAVGQVTPGPVFTTATFIGYVLGGVPGAIAATVGIFLPSFVFIALSGPLVPRLRRSPIAGTFLDGVNVASLALMTVVTWQLGRAAIFDATTLLLAVFSAILLWRFRLNSVWLIIGGAIAGIAIQATHPGV